MNTTKNRISILLKRMNLSQKEFSALTGVDGAIICRILKGNSEPSALVLRRIAETTNVSPSWILGFGVDENIEKIIK